MQPGDIVRFDRITASWVNSETGIVEGPAERERNDGQGRTFDDVPVWYVIANDKRWPLREDACTVLNAIPADDCREDLWEMSDGRLVSVQHLGNGRVFASSETFDGSGRFSRIGDFDSEEELEKFYAGYLRLSVVHKMEGER